MTKYREIIRLTGLSSIYALWCVYFCSRLLSLAFSFLFLRFNSFKFSFNNTISILEKYDLTFRENKFLFVMLL